MTTRTTDSEGPIVLFDGVCNLCNGVVRFTIDHDPDGRISFATLQSAAGQRLLDQYGITMDDLETFVLIEDGAASTRSTAAARLLRRIGGPWGLLGRLLGLVPRPLRDLGYRLVARSRYRIFGRRDVCMTPGPEIQDRFITD